MAEILEPACGASPGGSSPKRARCDSRRARIALVGAGFWSQGWHLPHLQRNPESEIIAIVDPSTTGSWKSDLKSVEELGELYKAPVYSSLGELLRSEVGASVDGVLIATPHASHYAVAVEAMNANLNVMLEKPMTTDVHEAHKLARAAASYNKILTINNSANFRDHTVKAYEFVRAGKIGEIEHVSCSLVVKMHGFLNLSTNTTWCKPSGSMLGNGFAWGQLSHPLAWVYMVTGLCPTEVYCHMKYSETSGADLYDSALVKCANGATISMQGVATLPESNQSGKLVENKIFGSEGCILYSGDDQNPASGDLILSRHDGKNQRLEGFYFENTAQEGNGPESLQLFIRGCLGQQFFNAADAQIGLRVVQTIEAMYRSAVSGSNENVAPAPAH